jgi:hypothetical protein
VGFLKDMSDSAVNFPEYRNIAHSPWKKVITYLLLIVLILGLPVLLSFAFDFNRGVDLFVSEFHKKVPDFVLKNGEQKQCRCPSQTGNNDNDSSIP